MSLTITIAGTPVSVLEGTLHIVSRVDDKDKADFEVLDPSGTATFQKGQVVRITDSVLGTLFTGLVNKPTATVLYPNAAQRWHIDCVSQFYHVVKHASKKRYRKRNGSGYRAGAILADQIQRYLAPDGVTGDFALAWTEQQHEWQTGTFSNTVSASNATGGNPGSGDLELVPGGNPITITTATTSDWTNNGTSLTCFPSNNNQLVPTNYQSISISAQCVGNQGNTCYDYYQIWSGSYTVQASDTLEFVEWINASSPQCMASVDAICTDGTYLSLFNGGALVDQQNGLKLAATTDLKGYADNQWYARTFDLSALAGKTISGFYLVFYGSNQGQYTAYFRDISINNPPGIPGSALWIYQDGNGLNMSQQAHTIGYSTTVVSLVTTYIQQATWVSSNVPANQMSGVNIYQTSLATYSASVPAGASLLVESSADAGTTWYPVTQNAALLGFVAGQAISGSAYLKYRLTMSVTGNDPTVQAIVNSVSFTIFPAYTATKSDVASTVSGNGFNSGTLTNTAVLAIPGTQRGIGHGGIFATNALMLNGAWRTWLGTNGNALSNQTLYGTASPVQAVITNSLQLTGGTGTDVRSRQDYAGSAWQNFTLSVDVQIPGSTDSVGVQYRTTNWVNQNNCGAWQVDLAQTNLKLGFGTNSGTTGSYTNVSTVNGLSFAAGSWHTITVVANGTSHKVSVDGVQYISITNATFNIAGYIGVRAYNSSGSTKSYFFNNFGVVAATSGTYQSPAISLNAAGVVGGTLIGVQTEQIPSSCSYIIQTSIDGGTTWQTATAGGAIPGLTPGTSVVGKSLLVKLTLSTTNASFTPIIDAFSIYVSSSYSSSGTRSTAPLAWDSMLRANVASGFGTATNGASYTQVGTGTTAVSAYEATIANTIGDVHEVLGSATGSDLEGTVRIALSAATIAGGIELRYTDSNHYYRLAITTTAINISKNTGAGTLTLATAAIALSTGVFYRLRFRVTGTVPTSLYGRLWQDGTPEPSTWNVIASD